MHIHQFKFIMLVLKEIIHNKQEIVGPSKYFCKSKGECKTLSLEELKK